MPKLYHADATSCSFDGASYPRAKDGSFDVPAAAVAVLVETFGFAPSPEEAKRVAEAGPSGLQEVAAAHVANVTALQAERDALAAQVKKLEAQAAEAAKPGKK